MAFFGLGSFGMGFFDEDARVDGIIDANDNDAGAVAGNDTDGSNVLTGTEK